MHVLRFVELIFYMLEFERHEQIFKIVEDHKYVDVATLASLTNVSVQTIRRDLNKLSKRGLIKRLHGGATLAYTDVDGYETFNNKQSEVKFREEKDLIASKAVSLIKRNMVIGLSTSTIAHDHRK